MEILLEIILRCSLGFGTLLFVTRLIGNKQLGQMNISTYISGIAIGAMAGGMVIYHDIEILESFVGILLWGLFTIIAEYVTLKSIRVRKLLNGQPVVVISNGVILYSALKRERLSLDDLTMLLRTNDIFRISDVDYAILEINGELTVLKKAEKEMVSKADLEIPVPVSLHLPVQVIAEGRILDHNLKLCGRTAQWLQEQIGEDTDRKLEDILYAELLADDQLFLQHRE